MNFPTIKSFLQGAVHYLEPFPRWFRTTIQMHEMFHSLRRSLNTFEEWFDLRFGWFFTNGMKHRSADRNIPKDPATRLRAF